MTRYFVHDIYDAQKAKKEELAYEKARKKRIRSKTEQTRFGLSAKKKRAKKRK